MKATNLEEHFGQGQMTRLSEKRKAKATSSDMYVVIHHPGSFGTGKTLCAQLSAGSGILWFSLVWIDPGR